MMKILTASVLGVVGIAASTTALADASMTSTYCKPGFYAGLQGGRGDTFYHTSDVFDQAGAVSTVNSTTTTVTLTNQQIDDVGISGRIYAGYQFMPYFAMEAGFTQFNKTDFSSDLTTTNVGRVNSTATADSFLTGEITERAVDVVGKATYALPMGFGVYAKGGLALITEDRTYNAPGINGVTLNNHTYQAVRPTYGAGIDYTIPTTNIDVEVFYSEIAGRGLIKTASMWGGGVAYKFA